MRVWCLGLLSIVAGCGAETSARVTCHPAPPPSIGVGVAHVAGRYAIKHSADETLLSAGAHRALELGATTLKVYLTPDYATKYPLDWPAGITSLASLASSAPMQEVLALPFSTIVFTTYSFAMGTGDAWREREQPVLLEREAYEFDELIRFLATQPHAAHRTYVFQNWEGDWALLAGTDPSTSAPTERAARMANWVNRRHRAIEEARSRYATADVEFVDALEVNRVLDADGSRTRVVTDVLPDTCVDLVSYSSWEATDVAKLAEPNRASAIEQRLLQALGTIREFAPKGSGVYLGELAFSETSLPNTRPLLTRALSVVEQHTLGSIYWQIFDNECSDTMSCSGYWVMRPDGTLSEAGEVLAGRWSKAQ